MSICGDNIVYVSIIKQSINELIKTKTVNFKLIVTQPLQQTDTTCILDIVHVKMNWKWRKTPRKKL